MNFEKRYRNSTLFFSISLLFLVAFLGVWLQNVYQDKVEELETEVSFLWLKSIKGLEENNFSKLIIATLSDTIHSTKSSSTQIKHINRLEILDQVWGDDSFFNSRNLDVYITKLRSYFKKDKNIKIITLRSVGYHFWVENSSS